MPRVLRSCRALHQPSRRQSFCTQALPAGPANNLAAHRVDGYTIVNISLKPDGGIPGDATADQMRLMADLAERYSHDELRVSHPQNIILPHVKKDDALAVWQALVPAELATANYGLAGDIIARTGINYCSLATARSIKISQAISRKFANLDVQEKSSVKINISGCINACGHHHVGHIGILGLDRGRGFTRSRLAAHQLKAPRSVPFLGPVCRT